MWVGHLLLVLLNLPLIGIWVRLLRVTYRVLFPAIVAFACIGTYAINQNVFDVSAIVLFAILGYVLVKLGCEPAPFLLGLRPGEAAGESPPARHGDLPRRPDHVPDTADLADAPQLAVVVLVLAVMPAIRRRREVVFQEEPA